MNDAGAEMRPRSCGIMAGIAIRATRSPGAWHLDSAATAPAQNTKPCLGSQG